jgi:DNA invertase Pin-like site-specific DNA recombinase
MPGKWKMPSRSISLRIKAKQEQGRKMARARWDADRARRDAEEPERIREIAEIEIQNLPRKQGDALGSLQWTDFRTGKVRRWVFRIGDRADQVTMEATDGRVTGSHGWAWILAHLRPYLCGRA